MSQSLKEQMAARKRINFERRARKGEQFKGVLAAHAANADRNKRRSVSCKETWAKPLKDYKLAHNDFSPEEVQRAQDRGFTLEEIKQAQNKRILSGPSPESYPEGVHERLKRLAKRDGLMPKNPDNINGLIPTYQNPTARGKEGTPDEHTVKVFALAERMQGVDFSAVPGLYDTKYGPQIKLHAVITWLLTGNLSKTEKVLDLTKGIVSSWKNTSDWWPLLVKAVQKERAQELDNELTTMITSTSDLIHDRLQDGDYKYNTALDKLVRVPVQAREAILIMDKAISNRNLLRGDPTSRTEQVSVSENLALLKKEFLKFAAADTIEGTSETINPDD